MTVKPVNNQIVVKVKGDFQEEEHSIELPESLKEKSKGGQIQRAIIDRLPSSYEFPLEVKEGDTVLIPKYSGVEVKKGDETYTVININELLARLD